MQETNKAERLTSSSLHINYTEKTFMASKIFLRLLSLFFNLQRTYYLFQDRNKNVLIEMKIVAIDLP